MREILMYFDAPHLFCAVEYDSFVNNLSSMVNGMKKILRDKDIEKLSVSNQHSYYCYLIPTENNPAAYLTFNIEVEITFSSSSLSKRNSTPEI
jgi:hypothetical protein